MGAEEVFKSLQAEEAGPNLKCMDGWISYGDHCPLRNSESRHAYVAYKI